MTDVSHITSRRRPRPPGSNQRKVVIRRAHTARVTKYAVQERYRPYSNLAEFHVGWKDYLAGRTHNPYGDDEVAAQAWDRGAEACMKWQRAGQPV
jgi:hypothetical protein